MVNSRLFLNTAEALKPLAFPPPASFILEKKEAPKFPEKKEKKTFITTTPTPEARPEKLPRFLLPPTPSFSPFPKWKKFLSLDPSPSSSLRHQVFFFIAKGKKKGGKE